MANTRQAMATSTTKITPPLPSKRKITQTLKAKKYILSANPTELPLILLILLILCLPLNLKAKSDFERLGDVLTLAHCGRANRKCWDKRLRGGIAAYRWLSAYSRNHRSSQKKFWASSQKRTQHSLCQTPLLWWLQRNAKRTRRRAFSAAGFVFYRYGWKPALPLIGLGILTDASRVYAHKHSIWQVLVGSAIGWGVAWGLTTRYKPRKLLITPEISTDIAGKGVYGLQVAYTW